MRQVERQPAHPGDKIGGEEKAVLSAVDFCFRGSFNWLRVEDLFALMEIRYCSDWEKRHPQDATPSGRTRCSYTSYTSCYPVQLIRVNYVILF